MIDMEEESRRVCLPMNERKEKKKKHNEYFYLRKPSLCMRKLMLLKGATRQELRGALHGFLLRSHSLSSPQFYIQQHKTQEPWATESKIIRTKAASKLLPFYTAALNLSEHRVM